MLEDREKKLLLKLNSMTEVKNTPATQHECSCRETVTVESSLNDYVKKA